MLDRFREYIADQGLCGAGDRILATVSGGIDSVVMLDLFLAAGFETGIAHCNFKLRGKESEDDESFVKSLARKHSLELHTESFQTADYAREKKISIQMAARNLRYEWFEEIRGRHGYARIATAHNQDDVLETFFINLSRGTGIRGLTGIPSRAGRIIRPLLFASREQIQGYARERELGYREDSSNTSDKYLRNRIRHKLLPMLEEQNPAFRSSLVRTIERLGETEKLFRDELAGLKKSLLDQGRDRISISLDKLDKMDSKRTILYEILADYDFSPATVEDIVSAIDATPGKQFFSPTHRLVKDREALILTPLKEDEHRRYYLELEAGQAYDPIDLEWVVVDYTDKFRFSGDPRIACLDLDLLEFPLILRHWEKGDYFQPFGMKGMKKISDYLIDQKVSRPDKENTWLLASGKKIIWVVGHRIDDRFRVRENTRQVLMIKHSPAV